jgi:hypothetical protein
MKESGIRRRRRRRRRKLVLQRHVRIGRHVLLLCFFSALLECHFSSAWISLSRVSCSFFSINPLENPLLLPLCFLASSFVQG